MFSVPDGRGSEGTFEIKLKDFTRIDNASKRKSATIEYKKILGTRKFAREFCRY